MSDQSYRNFSIGNVFSTSFSVFRKHFVFFTIVILGIAGLYSLWGLMYVNELQSIVGADVTNFDWQPYATAYAIGIVLYFVFIAFLNSLVTKATTNGIKEEEMDTGAIISQSVAILLPMAGLQFFYGTFALFGFILLIVPGFIIFLNYYIAAQVKVVEGLGVMQSMERSKALMKGNRLSVLAIFIILYIIYFVISSIIMGVLAVAVVAPNMSSLENDPQGMLMEVSFWMQIAGSIPYAIFLVLNIVFSTAIYHELVAAIEGGSVEDVSKVFN